MSHRGALNFARVFWAGSADEMMRALQALGGTLLPASAGLQASFADQLLASLAVGQETVLEGEVVAQIVFGRTKVFAVLLEIWFASDLSAGKIDGR